MEARMAAAQSAEGLWSPRRFGRLLLREAVSGYRGLLIAMAAVGGVLVLISALTAWGISVSGRGYAGMSGTFYLNLYQNLLFLGGFIVTSLAFREVWQAGGGIFYLTIPGSLFEKLASKLLVTAVGYGVGVTIFYAAAAALAEGVSYLIAGTGLGFFNPVDLGVLRLIVIYIVTQSLFLLGSIWFRKGAFIRTALWLVLFGIALAVIAGVTARIVLADHFVWRTVGEGVRIGGWSLDLNNVDLLRIFGEGGRGHAGFQAFSVIARIGFWVLAPVCWVAAYFRLGEAEV